MRLVSAAKYADLQYRYQRAIEARDKAEKLASDRLATVTRLAAQVDELRDEHPVSPVQHPEPVQGDAELRRQLRLAQSVIRGLSERLDALQASHIADTRELHDLRQGVAS
ncbi:hypothetical protein [Streptomyces sp. NPDC008240]|uniref:hypothetical protein n=1 Tax=Streptomyces sp. NPDC008240 TaxID=3364822 RepID=UPI0036E84F00